MDIKNEGELAWHQRDFALYPNAEAYIVERKNAFQNFNMFPGFAELKDETGLDLGCGHISVYHDSEFTHITAIDPLLQQYDEIYKPESSNVIYNYEYKDDGILPFADESFKFITCMNVIDHTLFHKELLNECYRVLKPDGIFFLFVNFCDYLWLPEHVKLWNMSAVEQEFDRFKLLWNMTSRNEYYPSYHFWGHYAKYTKWT